MDFREYLKTNKPVLIAEGYLFEFIRRGRVKPASFVPEVVLDYPECVRALHQEFVDAGTDVVQAFTYYANREKMRDVGREGELEAINRKALQIAKEVARENNKLFAGGLCNSNLYDPNKPETIQECENMFTEQCQWAKEAGVDYMIAETFWDYGEASLALKVMKRFDFPTVVSICPASKKEVTFDGVPIPEALARLESEGADVVTLNCARGPKTMLPLIEKCRAVCKGPLGCLPICYRTDEKWHSFQAFKYIGSDQPCYPNDLKEYYVSLKEIEWFAAECKRIGLSYIGLCCGDDPTYMRALSKTFGKPCALDKYDHDGKNVMSRDYSEVSAEKEEPNRYAGLWDFCR